MTNKIPVAILDDQGTVVNVIIIDEKDVTSNMIPLSEINNHTTDYNPFTN